MKKKVEEQLDQWLGGIYNEIFFWKNYMETRGGIFKGGFASTVEKNRKFVLEEDLLFFEGKSKINFIDVGSGPFSRCGFMTEKIELNCISVDPLADIYTILKKQNHLENGVDLRFGFVELLDKKFEKNSFDFVHMSNALDHSFDPVLGIAQLLYICKIGGKVILRHNENEAEAEQYDGFHQWNLTTNDGIRDAFIIWNPDERYDIYELYGNYADITCKKDLLEPQFRRVEMIKKKDILIPQNELYDIMLFRIYPFLLKTIYEDICKNNSGIKSYIYRVKREIERKKARK